jgi:hypothetical protein
MCVDLGGSDVLLCCEIGQLVMSARQMVRRMAVSAEDNAVKCVLFSGQT